MSKTKVTYEMVETWMGEGEDAVQLLMEIANGEYKASVLRQDIIDTNESING